ncbi:ABC transporter ATP-binding protein [Achromobacter sp. F4_2707]|uniref:ABC transporter ATP-binding protein n=1 Tax=Achromobacter sp. F4_2707 TaxID=3114286 RepID=UPI0039C72B63
MSSPLTLQVRDLKVSYNGREVLNRISLPDLHAGELIALAGPNGAGKSTFLKAIAGLVHATGCVRLDGRDCLRWSASERAQHVGFMPQALPEDTRLTVLEATLAALRGNAAGVRRQDEIQALQVIDRLGIGELALRPLFELSGGQRQLAALAQAVVRGSPLVLLDEPVSALDLAHQWQVMNEARRLADEGRIVIVVLHDLTLAAQWANRIAILNERQVHSFGCPAEVISDQLLQEVWCVRARVRFCEQGRPYVLVDGPASQSRVCSTL